MPHLKFNGLFDVEYELTGCAFSVVLIVLNRGYNIGTRLIEDFLSRTSLPRCADFREVAEVISKVRSLSLFLPTK